MAFIFVVLMTISGLLYFWLKQELAAAFLFAAAFWVLGLTNCHNHIVDSCEELGFFTAKGKIYQCQLIREVGNEEQ